MNTLDGVLLVFFIVLGLIVLQFAVDYRGFRRVMHHFPKDWQRWLLGEVHSPSDKTR